MIFASLRVFYVFWPLSFLANGFRRMALFRLQTLLICFLALLSHAALAQRAPLAGFGVVLMHGKGGQPAFQIASLAEALEAQGAKVVRPRMAWSGQRGQPTSYEIEYTAALRAIDPAIAELRSAGATKIVVAGQSIGANAAIAYSARYGKGLQGVMAIAPGHTPDRWTRSPEIARGVQEARALIAQGQGDTKRFFPDINQGRSFEVSATPRAWLSFFDPQGPGNMQMSAKAMPSIPFLWVIGRGDMLAAEGANYAYAKARAHPKSRYMEIDSGHLDGASESIAVVTDWLKTL
jgi:pimeloyl-ACP methyl ester carboxylesterase